MSGTLQPMPSGITEGELLTWLAAITGRQPEDYAAAVIVIGISDGRHVAVVPVHSGDGECAWDTTIDLLAHGISHVISSKYKDT